MPTAKVIRQFLLVTLCWLASTASAFCQIPQFPQTLPGSTVIGRLGTVPGPTQAIPFTTLAAQLQLYANIVLADYCHDPGRFRALEQCHGKPAKGWRGARHWRACRAPESYQRQRRLSHLWRRRRVTIWH